MCEVQEFTASNGIITYDILDCSGVPVPDNGPAGVMLSICFDPECLPCCEQARAFTGIIGEQPQSKQYAEETCYVNCCLVEVTLQQLPVVWLRGRLKMGRNAKL
jgi:hypothetical protein